MRANVISLSKVKRRKKFEAMKETFFSPVTLLIAGFSIIGMIGLYGGYYMDTSGVSVSYMFQDFYTF